MVNIKNVALVGAAGSLGESVLKELVASGKFNVTVVIRPTSTTAFPSSVIVVKADYTSVDSLATAFKGQDAIVSTVGAPGLSSQTTIIDAAIAAGVRRILPSEFGSDISNPGTAKFPVFADKVSTRNYIESRIAAGTDITYTYVVNGAFLDWGLQNAFILDWKSNNPTVFDSGDQKFSSTTLAAVGKAIVGVLSHYEETKNRQVYVQDIAVSQNLLLSIAKKVSGRNFEPKTVSLKEMKETNDARVAKGDVDMGVMYSYLFLAIMGEGYGGLFEKTDNELLGVERKTEADVEAIFRDLLAGN